MPKSLSVYSILKYLGFFALISCSYFLFGLFGNLFAIPPSKIGAIWPPSGIALASMLILGYRIWPAIFIGNIAITIWAFGFNNNHILLYLGFGLSACTSSVLGCFLIKKIVGFPNNLLEEKKILLFMLLAGPISCLSAPSLGVSCLYLFNIISNNEILVNWLTWWVGDCIGVLIFTPLILIIFGYPKDQWRKRKYSVATPVLITFTFVSTIFFYVLQLDSIRTKQHFNDQASDAALALKYRLQTHINSLHAIQNLFLSSDQVEKDEFNSFTRHSLQQFNEIYSIESFNIKKQNNRFIFSPVFFESTKQRTKPTQPDYLASIFTKAQQKFQQPIIFINKDVQLANLIMPVFTPNKEGHIRLTGLVLLNIFLPDLIHNGFDEYIDSSIFVEIKDTSDKLHNQTFFSNLKNSELTSVTSKKIHFAEQIWQLNFYLDNNLPTRHTHWSIWWVLVSGLLFTSLLEIALLLLTGRNFKTEEIVNERTKDLLKAKNMAEMANTAKDQFLATISHELRTPLNGIIGFTQILQKKTYFNDIDKEHINIIRNCSDQLLTLISDILDISIIGSNKIKFNYTEFNIVDLLNNLTAVFKLKADNKGISFIDNYDSLPIFLIGDQKRIQQIYVNLLSNGIKYTEKGCVTLSTSYQDGKLNLSVADTGCGIDKSNYSRIFSPFIQLNEVNTAKEGVGLGLAITKELITKMNGEIHIKSQLNKGSLFTVSIPLEIGKHQPLSSQVPKHKVTSNKNLNVLVADDNEINRLLLINLLEGHGCSISSVDNGEKALHLIHNNNFQLALIDISMPVLNGLQLANKLKDTAQKPYLVAVSAYADKNKIAEALSAGFNHYLTKPVDEKQLSDLINKLTTDQVITQ